MLFNSFIFIGFLVIVLIVFHSLRSVRAQNLFLLLANYVFYGWWDWRFLTLLALTTVTDYTCAIRMTSTADVRRRKGWLAVSLFTNLTLLGFFKYFNFFIDGAAELLRVLGFTPHLPTLRVILPVGISFYTFQEMAYTIDVYRKQTEPERDFFTFALFVSYFPQLVAGPIERARHLLPQLKAHKIITPQGIEKALSLILLGYFLKFVVADFSSSEVERLFRDPGLWHSGSLLSGAYLFAFQIFGDFAGYTSIARGVSLLFGVMLVKNFQQPYFSPNITEFWRRWHISLSSWLRDYVYIFWLGGNRHGNLRTYLNLIVTMLLGGLWHGANWTFVIWGGLHGCALSIHKVLLRGRKVTAESLSAMSTWGVIRYVTFAAVTFNIVCLGWVFFRSRDLPTAWQYLSGILRMEKVWRIMPQVFFTGIMFSLAELVSILIDGTEAGNERWRDELFRLPDLVPAMIFGILLVAIILFHPTQNVPFIYFQF
jgi:alginate O-acetyltransferase complex protein AlgI